MKFAGIDYGSRMAGTTVIALLNPSGKVQFFDALPKKDADAFVLQVVLSENIQQVFLDAPLSLPGKYIQPESYDDFFYRQADRDLKAMSPMFLGGLTARAMKLAAQLKTQNIEVWETYPGALARQLELKAIGYKKQVANLLPVQKALKKHLPANWKIPKIQNWHQLDALLALWSAYRFQSNQHLCFGNLAEGQIIV